MDLLQIVYARKCPKCRSNDYVFRGRRVVDAKGEEPPGQVTQTKYTCRACEYSWRERIPLTSAGAGLDVPTDKADRPAA